MSEKYMSIGAPMTELPLAQPRGHTSHSHRATSAMAGGAKFHDSCYNSHSNHHGNGVSGVSRALAVLDGKIAGKADDENIFDILLESSVTGRSLTQICSVCPVQPGHRLNNNTISDRQAGRQTSAVTFIVISEAEAVPSLWVEGFYFPHY